MFIRTKLDWGMPMHFIFFADLKSDFDNALRAHELI